MAVSPHVGGFAYFPTGTTISHEKSVNYPKPSSGEVGVLKICTSYWSETLSERSYLGRSLNSYRFPQL